jgi:hypothetical protein
MLKSTSRTTTTAYVTVAIAAILALGFFVTIPSRVFADSSPIPMTADNQSIKVHKNAATHIQLTGTGPHIRYNIIAKPSHGTLIGVNIGNRSNTGSITYIPDKGFVGVDTFEFKSYNYKSGIDPALDVTFCMDCKTSGIAVVTLYVGHTSHHFSGTDEDLADRHPGFNSTSTIPESHSGETKNSIKHDR